MASVSGRARDWIGTNNGEGEVRSIVLHDTRGDGGTSGQEEWEREWMQEGWSPPQGESNHIGEEIGLVSAWTGVSEHGHHLHLQVFIDIQTPNFQLNLIPYTSEPRAGA